MFKWIHHMFNPHCEHCRDERENASICDSCEVLKMELAHERREKELLLERILKEPNQDVEQAPPSVTIPRKVGVPWAVRRQSLEAEDRAKAKAMREAAKPNQSVEDLEKELDVEQEKTNV